MTSRRLPIVAVSLALGACAAKNPYLYGWSNYDQTLYVHYKVPQERKEFVEGLREVTLAPEKGLKVPPGCYAEYGYALLEEGQRAEAVTYFQKERDLWPESRPFMEKMIRNAERATQKESAKEPVKSSVTESRGSN